MVGLQLLHVAVELHEAGLLDDAHVGRDVAADAVAGRPPAQPAAMAAEGGQGIAHLADVHPVEREGVEVAVALVNQSHPMVVGVDVQPHAAVAEPVRQAHPERIDVEVLLLLDAGGQEVDVAELARMADGQRPRGTGVRHQPRRRLLVGQHVQRVALGVGQLQMVSRARVIDAEPVEVRGGGLQRAAARELPAHPREAGLLVLAGGHEHQRARLVVAGQRHRPRVAAALGQRELQRPPRGRLVEVGDAQRDVVEAMQRDHAVTRTGSRLTPLKKFERSRSGGPVSSMRSTRASSSSKAIRTSILARCAPMQWWMPPGPKAMCGLGERVMSKRSGSVKTDSSRLPETNQVVTLSPALIFVPASSVSTAAVRRKWCTGVAQRSISSAAVLRSASSSPAARSFSISSGCSSSASRPWVIVWRVVSLPAVASRTKYTSNSCWVSGSNASWVMMSSLGCLRRSAASRRPNSNISIAAGLENGRWRWASSSVTLYSGSWLPSRRSPMSMITRRSSCGTPRISAKTCIGISDEISRTKSNSPLGSATSRTSRVTVRTWSSQTCTARGVKRRLIRPRSSSWRG